MTCPIAASPLFAPYWIQAVYQLAYEQAQLALRPSWYERSQWVSLN